MVIGGERELVMTSVLITGLLGFTVIWSGFIWFLVPVILLELGALSLFRMMAKRDPCMTRVFIRSLKYAGRYPSQSIPKRR